MREDVEKQVSTALQRAADAESSTVAAREQCTDSVAAATAAVSEAHSQVAAAQAAHRGAERSQREAEASHKRCLTTHQTIKSLTTEVPVCRSNSSLSRSRVLIWSLDRVAELTLQASSRAGRIGSFARGRPGALVCSCGRMQSSHRHKL